jgi:hypothetical protein
MDKYKQVYSLDNCDNGKIKGFKTNKGKYVRLEMISDEEVIRIFVRSNDIYRIKIGYTYNLFSINSHSEKVIKKEGKKYREKEENVIFNESIDIYTDCAATIIFDDEEIIFGRVYNEKKEKIRPSNIDILDIEKIK